MKSHRFSHAIGKTALVAVLTAIPTTVGHAQIFRLDLDGTLEGRADGRKIMAELGPGATLRKPAEGGGVEPGDEGPAVVVPVPDGLWRSTGTLSCWFRPSRTIRFVSDPKREPGRVSLVDCPVLRADLSEDRRHPILRLTVPAAGDYQPKGSIFWSHLKGGRWYHLALAWDATRGRLEAYLNGVLQQESRLGEAGRPWEPPAELSGPLRLGGSLGEGGLPAKIAVRSVAVYPSFLDEGAIAATLQGQDVPSLDGEGRTDYGGPLDLAPYRLTPVYEADFTKPLGVVHEDELFDGDRRARLPEGKDWVFEGPGRAWTDEGWLHMESFNPQEGGHVVLWSTRVFPEDFLLEFGMSPKDSENGLNIVFLCANSREGGGIFDLDLPHRGGIFKNYHSGALNSYHVSYWACSAAADGGIPRRTANVRKNHGFYLVSCGIDRIAGEGPGPHRVRVLKVGGKLRVEARGRIAAAFDDDGSTYGSVWGSGAIGLRQMGHTDRASYTHFQVWKVQRRESEK